MFNAILLRLACELVWVCNLLTGSLSVGDGIARFMYFNVDQCSSFHPSADTHASSSSTSNLQGGSWKSASALNNGANSHDDLFGWLKILFVPALGLLLLAALLEEWLFAHGAMPAALPPMGGGVPQSLLRWFRQFCQRGPKITTAYQNQLKANSAAASSSSSSSASSLTKDHSHPSGTCTCNHGLMANGTLQSNNVSANSPSSDQVSSSPFSTPLSLQINFNGFNQLSGPLQYYQTFQRDEVEMNGKSPTTPSSPSTKVKTPPLSPTATAIKKEPTIAPSSTPNSPITSTTTNTTTTISFSSTSLSTPPKTEFIPITLSNEITGFSQTFSLWSGLNFGEILTYYVSEYWHQDEKKKMYEGIEGGLSDDESTDDKQTLPQTIPRPPLMLRYQGTRLSPLLTPAAVFGKTLPTKDSTSPVKSTSTNSSTSTPTIPTLEICIDYYLLFDRARHKNHATVIQQNERVATSTTERLKLSNMFLEFETTIGTLSKEKDKKQSMLTTLENDLKKLTKEIERIEKELNQLKNERKDILTTISQSVGLISNLKTKLEKEYQDLKTQHAQQSHEYQQAKALYTQGLDERHNLSNELKNLMIRYETLEKRCNLLKVHKIKHEKILEKIKKLEGVLNGPPQTNSDEKEQPSSSTTPSTTSSSFDPTQKSPAVIRMKHRYDVLEQEHNVLNVHLNELRLASHEIDDLSKNEHYKLRYRLKLLEKDARDLAKWKSLARASESDAKEAVKWKQALKGIKNHERHLEHELKELEVWKSRARRMEKEVKELRALKRVIDAGGELPPPISVSSTAALTTTSIAANATTSAPPGFESRINHGMNHTNTTSNHHLEFEEMLTGNTNLLNRAGSPLDDYLTSNSNAGLHSSISSTSATPPDLEHLFPNLGYSSNGTFRASSLLPQRMTSTASTASSSAALEDDFSMPNDFDLLDDDSDFGAMTSNGSGNFGGAFGGRSSFMNFDSMALSQPTPNSFDPNILNSRTPTIRPRELTNTANGGGGSIPMASLGQEVAANAPHEHETEFVNITTSTLSFLAE